MKQLKDLVARLSPRERRVIAAALMVIAVAWGLTRAAPRAAAWVGARRTAVVQLRESLARARDAVATEPAARESLAHRARELVSQAERLFGGASGAEAAAEMAGYVEGLAALRLVRIARQQAVADSARGLFSHLRVTLEAEGDIGGIAGWIADLEGGPKLVRVTDLAISAVEATAPVTQPERLRVGLDLLGVGATSRPVEMRARAEP